MTQIWDSKTAEVVRIVPEELKKALASNPGSNIGAKSSPIPQSFSLTLAPMDLAMVGPANERAASDHVRQLCLSV